jgi:hypothetical protein
LGLVRPIGNTLFNVERKDFQQMSVPLWMKIALRRPYTKATIGNMLPATFFSNVAGVEQKNAHCDTEVEKLILFYLLTVP